MPRASRCDHAPGPARPDPHPHRSTPALDLAESDRAGADPADSNPWPPGFAARRWWADPENLAGWQAQSYLLAGLAGVSGSKPEKNRRRAFNSIPLLPPADPSLLGPATHMIAGSRWIRRWVVRASRQKVRDVRKLAPADDRPELARESRQCNESPRLPAADRRPSA